MLGVWEYIKDVLEQVHDLERRLQTSKDNVEQIQKLMSSWSKTPLFERMEGKHTTLLNLSDREDRLRKRYDDVSQAGIKIHNLMQVFEFVSFCHLCVVVYSTLVIVNSVNGFAMVTTP